MHSKLGCKIVRLFSEEALTALLPMAPVDVGDCFE